jgi:DNA adenine methylase
MRKSSLHRTRLMVPHPIPYQGSKRSIAPQILASFPDESVRLVEPFAGSAAISLAAAFHGRAHQFWINDAHLPIGAIWRRIVHDPDGLSDEYAALWESQKGREREFYDKVRTRFNKSRNEACFLYLLARCVKAAIRYNSMGEFNNSPDNRRLGARPSEMKARIMGAHELLRNRTEVTTFDYKDVLEAVNDRDLIYMDPPYQGVSGNRDQRYCVKICHKEFWDLVNDLDERGFLFAISYDGRTGDRSYGDEFFPMRRMKKLEIDAGPSTQATLLGRRARTIESLYLSSKLCAIVRDQELHQRVLFT